LATGAPSDTRVLAGFHASRCLPPALCLAAVLRPPAAPTAPAPPRCWHGPLRQSVRLPPCGSARSAPASAEAPGRCEPETRLVSVRPPFLACQSCDSFVSRRFSFLKVYYPPFSSKSGGTAASTSYYGRDAVSFNRCGSLLVTTSTLQYSQC